MREVQEAEGDGHAGALPDGVPGPSAHEDQRNRSKLCNLATASLTGTVPRGDVGDFVRHHARKFRFRVRFEN